MSIKNAYGNLTYVVGHSLGASFNTAPINLQYFGGAVISLVWTGTPTGTFQVAGSVDGMNFDPLIMNAASASGSAGSFIFDVTTTQLPFLQVQWIYTSGSGTLNASYFQKG